MLCVGLEFLKIHRYVIFVVVVLILPETCTPKRRKKSVSKAERERKR